MLHDMVVYQKHYDLMLYAFPIINRFPKNQRFVLGQQMQNCMLDIAQLIVQANAEHNKGRTLWQIDNELEKLRLLTRLAKDLNIMAVKQYGLMGERISEIGRLLGGWIKSQGR
jgi:four helix bundle protein